MERKRTTAAEMEPEIPVRPADTIVNPMEMKAQLEKELAEKRRELEGIETESPQNYEDLKIQSESAERLLFETSSLETQIDTLTSEIETLELQEKSDARAAILEKADDLSREKKKLLIRLEQIDIEGQKLRTQFEEQTPKKRIQIESSQMLKWQRTIKESRAVFTLRGKPIPGEETSRQEETVSDAMPSRVKAMKEAGWQLVPGQEIVSEEVLTTANSREFPMIALPTIFVDFV